MNYAVLCDLNALNISYATFEKAIAELDGKVVYSKFYGYNAKRNNDYTQYIRQFSCDVAVPLANRKKIRVDIRQVIDAVTLANSNSIIDGFFLICSHIDALPMVVALKSANKKIIIGTTSGSFLSEQCDKTIIFDRFVGLDDCDINAKTKAMNKQDTNENYDDEVDDEVIISDTAEYKFPASKSSEQLGNLYLREDTLLNTKNNQFVAQNEDKNLAIENCDKKAIEENKCNKPVVESCDKKTVLDSKSNKIVENSDKFLSKEKEDKIDKALKDRQNSSGIAKKSLNDFVLSDKLKASEIIDNTHFSQLVNIEQHARIEESENELQGDLADLQMRVNNAKNVIGKIRIESGKSQNISATDSIKEDCVSVVNDMRHQKNGTQINESKKASDSAKGDCADMAKDIFNQKNSIKINESEVLSFDENPKIFDKNGNIFDCKIYDENVYESFISQAKSNEKHNITQVASAVQKFDNLFLPYTNIQCESQNMDEIKKELTNLIQEKSIKKSQQQLQQKSIDIENLLKKYF